ncbi:MAG: MoxR family ATPase [Thermofilum sp.]
MTQPGKLLQAPNAARRTKLLALAARIKSYFVGHDDVVNLLLVSLLSEGHLLIEGPPGTGKTLLARVFASGIGGTFKRIQMTPDLLPADIIGTVYYNLQSGSWEIQLGPIFANVVFVDELSRATPRTQAALIEAMQERQVSIGGRTFPLPRPFLLIATRVSGESEGIFELPTGEVDRFSYSVSIPGYDPEVEAEVLRRLDFLESVDERRVLTPEDIQLLIEDVKKVYVHERIRLYVISLLRAVRQLEEVGVKPSTRAAVWLTKGARALAYLAGRSYVLPDDVKALAVPVLRHRIGLKPEYELDGVATEQLIQRVLREVEVPKT